MNKTDFKILIETLKTSTFTCTFKQDKKTEAHRVCIEYNVSSGKGSSSFLFDYLKDDQKVTFIDLIRAKGGKIPSWLVIPQTAGKETKNYRATRETIHFDKNTYRVIEGTVDLSTGTIVRGKLVVSDSLPGYTFVLHPVLNKTNPGCGVLYNGLIFSGATDGWKESGRDPLNLFIGKILEVGIPRFDDILRTKFKDLTKTEPKTTQPPQPVEKLTGKTVQKVYSDVLRTIKGTDPDVYDSWGVDRITRSWEGNQVTVSFTVQGFIHTGLVSVKKDVRTGVYSVVLWDGFKPGTVKRTITGIPGAKLCDTIDRAVEFDTTVPHYQELVQKTNKAA